MFHQLYVAFMYITYIGTTSKSLRLKLKNYKFVQVFQKQATTNLFGFYISKTKLLKIFYFCKYIMNTIPKYLIKVLYAKLGL
jgi:hypothetical protein